jgi:hypothetical protein
MDIMAFMHLDLGEEYTDHHTFFLQRASPTVGKTYVHNTSFEVADLVNGPPLSAKKEWKSVWGVGRHILDSQIFDYWYDSSKSKIEHHADGDVVNCDNATRREPVGRCLFGGLSCPGILGITRRSSLRPSEM